MNLSSFIVSSDSIRLTHFQSTILNKRKKRKTSLAFISMICTVFQFFWFSYTMVLYIHMWGPRLLKIHFIDRMCSYLVLYPLYYFTVVYYS